MRNGERAESDRARPGPWAGLAAGGVLLAAAGVWFALFHLPSARAANRARWSEQLGGRAELRKIALDRWLARGLADARTLASYPSFRALVTRGHGSPPGNDHHVQGLLEDFARIMGYERATLVDSQGRTLLDCGPSSGSEACPHLGRFARAAAPTVSFHVHADGIPRVAFVAPVADPAEGAGGAVSCEEDPERWLYSFLAGERLGLRTGEVLLAGREGDEVVFLNPLRHWPGAALTLRRPLADARMAAASALQGGPRFGDFLDYRGQRVLAATRRLEGAPIALVVKLDEEEALGAFHEQALSTALAMGGALATVLAVGLALFRRLSSAHEDQLRRLWRALEQSPVSVVITDAGGSIEYVNPKFTEVTGYTAAEALGQNPRILKSGETPDEVYADLWRTIAAGKEWRGEIRNRRKDGSLFWEQASISPVRNTKGVIARFVAVKEDVTERKAREEALRSAEKQLVQAQKMEAIGRLAGGVAHDFNNILNVVMGYAELLSKNAAAGVQRERIEHILKAAARAAGLTRQLLAFSRRQILAPRVVDLREVVAETVEILRRLLGEDIELRVEAPPRLACVRADPGQVGQILMNLALNSRDAMPDGGRLTIELDEVALDAASMGAHLPAPAGPYVRLTVSDDGCGMAPEVRAHAFEPFFTTKEPGRGTGLGLATVYGIVKQSGGYVWLYSEPGHGTTVRIYLPRVDEARTREIPALSRRARGRGETVLLVEDDGALRALGKEILETNGYRVLAAGRGDDALALADREAGPIEVLVTDVIMPGMPARELIRALRLRRPGLRVLCVSGYTDDAISRKGVLDAGLRLLPKPFTEAELTRAVEEVLGEPAEPPTGPSR